MNKKISATIITLSLAVTAIAGNSLFATKAFAKNQNNISGTAIETKYSATTAPKLSSGEITEEEATKKGMETIKNKYGIDVSDMSKAILFDKDNNTWNMCFAPDPNKDKTDDIEIRKMTIGPNDITNIPDDQKDNVYDVYSKSGEGFNVYSVQINAKTGEALNVQTVVMGRTIE